MDDLVALADKMERELSARYPLHFDHTYEGASENARHHAIRDDTIKSGIRAAADWLRARQ